MLKLLLHFAFFRRIFIKIVYIDKGYKPSKYLASKLCKKYKLPLNILYKDFKLLNLQRHGTSFYCSLFKK